jgi:hypothetical protein
VPPSCGRELALGQRPQQTGQRRPGARAAGERVPGTLLGVLEALHDQRREQVALGWKLAVDAADAGTRRGGHRRDRRVQSFSGEDLSGGSQQALALLLGAQVGPALGLLGPGNAHSAILLANRSGMIIPLSGGGPS